MTDNPLSLVIPLIKFDEERHLIVARAAAEEPDKAKEILDYATAKPAFQKWSNEHELLSGGLKKGNVRAMHQKVAAGNVNELSFDDSGMAVNVVLKITDDNEWRKCLAGTYTGLSIGGGYLKKWQDPTDSTLTRYTPDIREISLVDTPCIPSARFAELIKADGMVAQIELRGHVPGFAESWAARPRGFAEQWAARPRTFAEMYRK